MNEIYIIPKHVPVVVRITGGTLSEETVEELKEAMDVEKPSSHYIIACPPGVKLELLAPVPAWTCAPAATFDD